MSKKDTIYIDIEDDITSVINKVSSSKSAIVALVLPKRFSVLQSSVNMKLLKKTSIDAKRKVVLITTETGLLPLAGAAGIHVAESLKSRPQIPKTPDSEQEQLPKYEEEPEIDPAQAVGELKDGPKKAEQDSGNKKADKKVDSKEVAARKSLLARIKFPGKLKIPSFSRFRNKVILGLVGLLIFVVGWVFAFIVLPEANISIQAQTSKLPTTLNFKANPNRDGNNLETGAFKAEVKEIKKNVSRTFLATGEKDKGEKASGAMTIQNCDSSDALSVPSGTIFTDDTSGFSFESTEATDVPGGSFSGGDCDTAGEATVNVVAVESGDTKNLSPRGYEVDGFSVFVTGFGGQMSGGTSVIVKTVTQADLDKAAVDLEKADDADALQELIASFEEGSFVLGETFTQTAGTPKSEPAVGQEATEARVTAEFTFSIIAVNEQALTQYLEAQQQEIIEGGEQAILDNGLTAAVVTLKNKKDGVYNMLLNTDAFIGPEIDTQALAEEISGKRFSEVESIIKSKAGVRETNVEFSPFWVFNAPRSSKINITIEVTETAP